MKEIKTNPNDIYANQTDSFLYNNIYYNLSLYYSSIILYVGINKVIENNHIVLV